LEISKINHFPELESERLTLRYLTIADIEFIHGHFSDPEVSRYLLDEDPVSDRGEAEAIVRHYLNPTDKNFNRWGLMLKSSGRLIGTCGFHKWDQSHNRAEVGYDLNPGHWGQGFMKEALSVAFRHAFDQLGLHRIDAMVFEENERSTGILKSFGFRREGVLRDYYFQAGKYHDHSIYSLLKTEFESSKRIPSPGGEG
jgi:[ribosomal protein S5]-alanine N-acetyltransferase